MVGIATTRPNAHSAAGGDLLEAVEKSYGEKKQLPEAWVAAVFRQACEGGARGQGCHLGGRSRGVNGGSRGNVLDYGRLCCGALPVS